MAIQKRIGRVTLTFFSSLRDPASLLRELAKAPVVQGRGRGGIRIVESEGLRLVIRQYRHGGLFRAFTGARYATSGRAMKEAVVTEYLRHAGFPVVEPFCVVAERRLLFARLHLATVYEENRGDLLQCLQVGTTRERLQLIGKFAKGIWLMEQAGVYHPDLHLRNVLVTGDDRLVFLDLDKARRKQVGQEDMVSMFRRLDRFADKMDREGAFHATRLEKALFLRAYQRLSGRDLASELETSARRRSTLNRLGWYVEFLLYGKRALALLP
jgi:hypothetical protein